MDNDEKILFLRDNYRKCIHSIESDYLEKREELVVLAEVAGYPVSKEILETTKELYYEQTK